MSYIDLERPNAPTFETQEKVRKIIKDALAAQRKHYDKEWPKDQGNSVIDVLSYAVDNIAGTKRVLYSLPEFTGSNYSAMYHLAHAKRLHHSVIAFLKKELAFLAPAEQTETK